MIPRITIALFFTFLAAGAAGLAAGAQEKAEPFRLEAGDYRWQTIAIHQTPVQVDCQFEVLSGNPSVHVELLPLSGFRQFDRGLEYDGLAATPDGRTGDLRRIIDVSGEYRCVAMNGKNSPPATVTLEVHTSVNIARTLPPRRRLTVIAISFAFFFMTVTWSARTLIRAMRPE